MRKRFGQHFLIDHNIIEKIVSFTHASPTQTVLEIGPGPGTLTKPLLEKHQALTAVEIDRDLVSQLSVLQEHYPDFTLINDDVLNWLESSSLVPHTIVVGNLPYNITTPIFFGLLRHRQHIDSAIFMIQKEVALRMAAEPKTKQYGRLTVMMQYYFEVDVLFHVGPQCFKPPPKVTSSVIRLQPKPATQLTATNPEFFGSVVKLAFGQRRKQLRNALSSILETAPLEEEPLLTKRAEHLSLQDYIYLSNRLWQHQSTNH